MFEFDLKNDCLFSFFGDLTHSFYKQQYSIIFFPAKLTE
ncbi:hypothetical protein HMPREF1565_0365 [Providencia alcalifaciens RIMD 1656011]|uniref:Uncharacterized protein n=1 Tax=Providencia alcalifaciens 205/92 TaxID=1256988 RepID=A0AAV3M503_9GAMM|nr:hypothetical protein HMPREF1565_0365 [Providencia alcalifaciens RIMD 1656011]EUD07050.1 hypothetical protein HMPREF1564_0460 [Providencia alcalifaciens R90-1475]EUD10619.1 hypothetical protein HMPREF1563_1963 [Providencia alcalifaciens 205/92]